MKGDATFIIRFMEGADKRFIIPVYQRNYDWRIEQCKQLFDDLVKTIKNNRKTHFFGSIVSVNNPDGGHYEFLIIDGQQRLTTVSLLLLSMHNLIKNAEVVPQSRVLGERIHDDYLVDKWQPVNKRIKLKPIKNDSSAYEKLFGEEDEMLNNSNLTINYQYFADRIRRNEISIDDLFAAIGKLEIIDIALNPDDNPQLIFESLNSTGLDLSEGDKIRNYILMSLSVSKQEEYYAKYWNPIEVKTDYDVSGFIRDYLSVKQMVTPAMEKVYVKFKEYVENTNTNVQDLLKELLVYAKRYDTLLHGKTGAYKIDHSINRLNRLKTTVIRPFLLEVFREHEEGNVSIVDVQNILLTIESYLFRRSICDLPTNSLNKIFLLLHKEIMRFENNPDCYFEKMKYVLANKKEKTRFPRDREFIEALETQNIYSMPSKNKWYLFERIENGDSKESKNIYEMLEEGEYTIEHIMPQHLTPLWQHELGNEFEKIHNTWLHRLANLTLTAYNSKYSNRSFVEKRDMKNGFMDSGFKINLKIALKDNWTLCEIEERNNELKTRALELWKFADSAFQPQEKPMDEYDLDDDMDFTGETIAKFRFKGVEQPAESWADMYQKVLIMLHQDDKSIFNHLVDCGQDEAELAMHVGRSSDNFSNSCLIEENIFVLTGTSTQYKLNTLRKFFTLFGVPESELIFYLKDGDKAIKDESTSHELRYRYWSRALPAIQRRTNIFSNINPTKQNWVSGATGQSGIIYSIVTNMGDVRAELYIGTKNKEYNKKVYDTLLSQKDEIEKDFGEPLIWTRLNDKKASRICVLLNNVSIGNENDWDRMIEFQAEKIKMMIIAMQKRLDEI